MSAPFILSLLYFAILLCGCAAENISAPDGSQAQKAGAKTDEYEKKRSRMVERQIRDRDI